MRRELKLVDHKFKAMCQEPAEELMYSVSLDPIRELQPTVLSFKPSKGAWAGSAVRIDTG